MLTRRHFLGTLGAAALVGCGRAPRGGRWHKSSVRNLIERLNATGV
jgi:hypothetical protein